MIFNFFVERNVQIQLNNYILWLFLFYGFCYLSYLWAKNKSDLMLVSNTFIQIFGTAIALTQQIKNNDDIIKIFKLINLALSYSLIVLCVKTPIEIFGTERIGSAIGVHSNALGFRLATGALLCMFLFTKSKKYRWVYLATAIIYSILVLFTGSRKSIVMVVFCLLIYVFLYRSKDNKGFTSLGKISLCIVIVVFIVVLWNLIMNVESIYNVIGYRIETMLGSFSGKEVDGSIDERTFFTEKGIELFKQHPIIGYGCNNFKQYMRELGYSHIAYCHNNLVELLCTLGIIGTLLFYAPLTVFLIELVKIYLKSKNDVCLVLVIFMCFTYITTGYSVYYFNEFSFLFFFLVYVFCDSYKKENAIDKGKR